MYLYIYLSTHLREWGRKGEREGEKHRHEKHQLAAPRRRSDEDRTRNPGMCPDWELNCQPFSSQADTQSTEPHQPGRNTR